MINYLAPKKVLTPAEYFSKFVNFYGESLGAASGIQTTTESPTDTTTPGEVPSIYDDPAGEKDLAEEGRLKAERILSDPSGGLQFFDTTDAVHDTMESFDFSEALGFGGDMVNADSFFGSMVDTPYGTKQSFKPGLGFTLGLGAISGGMLAAPMALGHALNMQGAAITAGKVKSTLDPVTGKFTGGALMEINGIKVYRDPGSFIYNGSRRGMSNAQLKAMEGFQRHGYVGDWSETANPSITDSFGRVRTDGLYSQNGNVGYLYKITGDSKAGIGVGGDYDPATGSFKFAGGGGSAMGSKQAAEIAVGDLHAKYGLTEASFSYRNVAKARQIAKATGQRWDNVLDGLARQQAGAPSTYGGTTGSLASAKSSYAPGAAYKRTGMADFFTDEARKQRASEIAKGQAQKAAAEAAAAAAKVKAGEQVAGGSKSDPSGGGVKDGGGAFGGLTDRQKDSAGRSSAGGTGGNPGDKSTWAEGGRVGMQAGGEAGFAQRPEFVGGNETPTNRQSIADNVPREVPEGTFVINAAAVDFAGREDIEKMVRKAYAKAGQGTQTGTAQEVDIAVSNGEVLIPPHIAKIIGYDRLNKINNRGKKEISRRQEERQQAAGGGFIGRKKFAEGDRVTVYRGEPLDPSRVSATDYGYGKENVGKYHTPDIKKARRFAAGAGKGNQVIKSRKVTIDELFDGVEEAWKTSAKKRTDYFAKMPKSELNKSIRFVRTLKKDYLAGKRSLESMATFLQEQVFQDDKSKINFIETFKNDPKSAGKLAGKALTKVATKATPPLAILGVAAEIFTPSQLGDATLNNNNSFLDYSFTPSK